MSKLLYSAMMSRTNQDDDPNAGTDKEGGGTADHGIRFATDLGSAVALSKEPAGDSRYVSVLGADAAGQLIEAGELDEVVRD